MAGKGRLRAARSRSEMPRALSAARSANASWLAQAADPEAAQHFAETDLLVRDQPRHRRLAKYSSRPSA